MPLTRRLSPPALSLFALSIFAPLSTVPARSQTAPPAAVPLPLGTQQPPASAAPIDDPKAAALVREAAGLEQRKNWTAATEKLDQANAVNPRQAFLWSSYGYIALVGAKPDEAKATEDLQREIANHPEEENVYTLLVQVQMRRHLRPDAIVTLQKLVAYDPANANAIGILATMLIAEKQFPAAEKVVRSLLAAQPGNVQAQLLLATTLVRQDKRSEATTLLKSIVEKSQDPGLLNNAAYTLADESLDPALAEQISRHSLALLEQLSPSGATNTTPLVRSQVLVSIWDTLGWALLREGKAAVAEPWVRAAWSNSLGAEPGYHLGMILEKEGQPVKAMAMYQIAAFGDPASDPAIAENIAARQAALRKAGTPDQVADAKAAFQAQRTFKVPGNNTLTGKAIVEIDLSSAGATNAIIVRDDSKDALTPLETSLYRIAFKTEIPPGTNAKITRRGSLICHAGTACQFVLLSTREAAAN